MFEKINKPNEQVPVLSPSSNAGKPNEILEQQNITATPKSYYKPYNQYPKKSILLIVAGFIFLIFLGAAIYFFYANKNTVAEPTQNTNENTNLAITTENDPLDITKLTFPDGYFLAETMIPLDLQVGEMPAPQKEDLDILNYIYTNATLDSAEEIWTKPYKTVANNNFDVILIKYKSADLLNLEINKIISTQRLKDSDDKLVLMRKDNIIIGVSGGAKNEAELDVLVNTFKDKLSAETIKIFTSKKQLVKIETAVALAMEILHCYILSNPQDITYFPDTKIKEEYNNLITLDKNILETSLKNECISMRQNPDQLTNFVQVLHTDNDQDGLTAYFEYLYRSSDDNQDSDGDTYKDLDEIKNGYSPSIDERGAKEYVTQDGQAYITYTDNNFGYSTVRPKHWTSNQNYINKKNLILSTVDFWPNGYLSYGSDSKYIVIAVSRKSNFTDGDKTKMLSEYKYENYILGGLPAYTDKEKSSVLLFKKSPDGTSTDVYSLDNYIDTDYGRSAFTEILKNFQFSN